MTTGTDVTLLRCPRCRVQNRVGAIASGVPRGALEARLSPVLR